MTGPGTAVLIAGPVCGALVAVLWPAPVGWFLFVVSLRLRVVDDPVRAVVVAHPDGRDWFLLKLRQRRDE